MSYSGHILFNFRPDRFLSHFCPLLSNSSRCGRSILLVITTVSYMTLLWANVSANECVCPKAPLQLMVEWNKSSGYTRALCGAAAVPCGHCSIQCTTYNTISHCRVTESGNPRSNMVSHHLREAQDFEPRLFTEVVAKSRIL